MSTLDTRHTLTAKDAMSILKNLQDVRKKSELGETIQISESSLHVETSAKNTRVSWWIFFIVAINVK